jgi:hypothetical protein
MQRFAPPELKTERTLTVLQTVRSSGAKTERTLMVLQTGLSCGVVKYPNTDPDPDFHRDYRDRSLITDYRPLITDY